MEQTTDPTAPMIAEYDQRKAALVQTAGAYSGDVRNIFGAVEGAAKKANEAHERLKAIDADLERGRLSTDMADKQRQAIRQEATEAAEALLATAGKVVQALPARFMSQALGRQPKRGPESLEAKMDLTRVLDATQDHDLMDTFVKRYDQALTEGDDTTATLLVGPWGSDYLQARFRGDPQRHRGVWDAIKAMALPITATKGTGARKQAALLATKAPEITQAFILGREVVRHRLERLGGQ